MRQAKEDQIRGLEVAAGYEGEIGRLPKIGMAIGHGPPGQPFRGHLIEPDLGVPKQQPDQFAPGVPRSADHRDADHRPPPST